VDEYLAEIRLFAGMYEPRGWMFCDGRLLSIAQNLALFSLLGTTYGGDGVNTFALPDLRGRVPVGAGAGPGLTPRALGETGGSEQHALNTAEIPAHTHTILANNTATPENSASPTNAVYAVSDGGDAAPVYATATPDTTLAARAMTPTGDNQPHPNMQPALGLNYIICVCGTYPNRD
jgi:microcystin-dependent protein